MHDSSRQTPHMVLLPYALSISYVTILQPPFLPTRLNTPYAWLKIQPNNRTLARQTPSNISTGWKLMVCPENNTSIGLSDILQPNNTDISALRPLTTAIHTCPTSSEPTLSFFTYKQRYRAQQITDNKILGRPSPDPHTSRNIRDLGLMIIRLFYSKKHTIPSPKLNT